jgi:hypothetical protein
MQLLQHERGIHAVRPGAGGAGVAGVRFRVRAAAASTRSPEKSHTQLPVTDRWAAHCTAQPDDAAVTTGGPEAETWPDFPPAATGAGQKTAAIAVHVQGNQATGTRQ